MRILLSMKVRPAFYLIITTMTLLSLVGSQGRLLAQSAMSVWDPAYSYRHNIPVINNMPATPLPIGYPIRLHLDNTTMPTASEIYAGSLSTPKCNDLRIVYNDSVELNRIVQNCSSTAIDIWFRSQVNIPGGSSNTTAHQLYYGNAGAGSPPRGNDRRYDFRLRLADENRHHIGADEAV